MRISKELKIALVAVCGIAALFFGMNFLKGMSLLSNDHSYYIRFNDISGLSSSSPIYADGYKVGVVKRVAYDYAHNSEVIVQFDVDDDLRIPAGSTAEIVSDLMGNVKMNLLLANNPRERVHPGDTITGAMQAGLMDKAALLLPAVEQMLPKLDSILGNLNALLADPALSATLHNAQAITDNLNTGTRQLNTLLATLGRDVPVITERASATLDNAEQFTARLGELDLAATLAKVDATMQNIQHTTDQLNSREGTVGLLLNDPSLYNNLNRTMSSADSLLIDLRQHPKRYVHFSLFGRKDK